MAKTLVWFRNDLRIHDNEVLTKAHQSGEVLPVYCFDPKQFEKTSYGFHKTGSLRAKFLIESVENLKKKLGDVGGSLVIRIGKPEEEISRLVDHYGIDQIFAHKEITSEETVKEEDLVNNSEVPVTFFGAVHYSIGMILFLIRSPFRMYLPNSERRQKKTQKFEN